MDVEIIQFAFILIAFLIGLNYGLLGAIIAVIIVMIIVVFLGLSFTERLYERLQIQNGVQNYILLDENSKRITQLTAFVGLVSVKSDHSSEMTNDNILLIDGCENLHIIIKNILSDQVEFTFIPREKDQLKAFLSNSSEFNVSNGEENIATVKVLKVNL